MVFPKLPLRADRFVVKHLQWLQGELKLLGSIIPAIETSKKKIKKSGTEENRLLGKALSTVENWKGKNRCQSPSFEQSSFSVTDSSRVTEEDLSYDRPCSVSFDSTENSEDLSLVSNNLGTVFDPLLDCTSGLVESNSLTADLKLDSPPLPISPVPNVVLSTTETRTHVNDFSENYSFFDGSNSIVEQQHNPPPSLSLVTNDVLDCNPKKSKSTYYLAAFPEWDMSTSVSSINISILKNGNLAESLMFKNKRVLVKNTCAFGSFLILYIQRMQASKKKKREKASRESIGTGPKNGF